MSYDYEYIPDIPQISEQHATQVLSVLDSKPTESFADESVK